MKLHRPFLCSACFVVASGVIAQLLPEQRFLHTTTTAALLCADADGDGDIDVLRGAGDRLLLHQQVAPDTFRVAMDLGVATATDIRMGDIDNDLVQDVVVGDLSGDRIRWARGLGGGDYLPLQDLVVNTPDPYDVHLSDVDLDGDVDLAHVDVNGMLTLRWNENLGGGSFGPSQPILSWTGAPLGLPLTNLCAVGDVDQDGDPDIAVSGPGTAWYANDGNGAFTSMPLAGGGALSDPLLTDLNGDGAPDILFVSPAPGPAVVGFLNQGLGSFGAQQTFAFVGGGSLPLLAGLHDLDIDGDGDRDLAGSYRWDYAVTCFDVVLLNDGSGALGGPAPWAPFDAEEPRALGTGDLDLDGMDDIVTLDNSGLFIQYSVNGFRRLLTSVDRPERVVVLDVDGDADSDVLVLGQNTWSPIDNGSYPLHAALHRNPGSGSFADAAEPLWVAASSLVEATTADLDGDGDDDAVMRWTDSITGSSHRMHNFLSDGVSPQPSGTVGGNFLSDLIVGRPPCLRDLDGDGDVDLLYKGLNFELTTASNAGNGIFGPTQTWPTGSPDPPFSETVCDADADGDADIVWVGIPATALFWSANDGLGNFSTSQVLAPVPFPFPELDHNSPVLTGIDLNADGWEDLLVFTGERIGALLNNAGTWTMGQQFMANATAYAVGDIDNSGSPDLVAIRSNREVVTWLNMGLGIFAPELLLADQTINSGTDHLALADVDGDGLTDVITCSAAGHSAAWMRNGGNIGTGLITATPIAPALHVFPVPMRDHLHVTCAQPVPGNTLVQVLDVQGRILRTLRGNGTNTLTIHRDALAPGLYVLRVEGLGAARFVVE